MQGSRFNIKKNKEKFFIKRNIDRIFLTKVLNKLNNFFYVHGVQDTQIDFKIFNKKIILDVIPDLKLKHDGMKMTEIITRTYGYGYKILEKQTDYIDSNKSVTLLLNYKNFHKYFFFIINAFLAYLKLYFIIFKERKNKKMIKSPLKGFIKWYYLKLL